MASTMRIGGLASGMDIDSIVEKLMQAEKAPLNKLEQQKQKYEWERDAYREINTALQSFDDFLFSDYRLTSNFYKKTVSSSNSSLVTATATTAASGSLSIEAVSQLASSARVVGNTINASGSTKLSALGITESSVTLNAIQSNGKLLDEDVTISIDQNETVDSFLKKINSSNVGITAIFENGKISFTAKNTGNIADGGEMIVKSGANVFNKLLNRSDFADGSALANNGKNAILTINGISTEKNSNTFTINGYNITLNQTFNNTQSIGQSYIAATENKANTLSNYYDKLISLSQEYGEDVESTLKSALSKKIKNNSDVETDKTVEEFYSSLSTNVVNFLKDNKNNLPVDFNNLPDDSPLKETFKNLTPYEQESLKSLSKDSINDVIGLINILSDTEKNLNSKIQEKISVAGEDLKQTQNEKIKNKSNVETDKTVEEFYSSLSTNVKNFLKNNKDNLPVDFNNLSDGSPLKEAFEKLTQKEQESLKDLSQDSINDVIELINIQTTLNKLNTNKTSLNDTIAAKRKNEAIYDNAKSTLASVTGSISDEELLKKANELSTSEPTVAPVTLTSSTDVDDMVDKIKKFVETYNGLVTTINTKLKETKYRDYEPLTDEQREEMKEDQIEKWEAKAKSGILRNDSILTNGLYSLRRTFSEQIQGLSDSTMDSLAEIGITTTSTYSDGGKLQINEEKLRAAIEKNPDQVAAIFTKTGTKVDSKNDTRGLAQKLRDELSTFKNNIEKKAGKSTSTNQNFTIGKRLDEITNRIDSWKTKLKDIENRYWKQFTAMEQAINKANTQASLFMPQ